MNEFYVELFLRTRATAPARIILDIDASDDPTHGAQQLSLFQGHYEQHQYFPLFVFDGESGFPLATWLRSGTAHASWGAVEALEQIVAPLRAASPGVEIVVQADAGYSIPALLTFAEEQQWYGRRTFRIEETRPDSVPPPLNRDHWYHSAEEYV